MVTLTSPSSSGLRGEEKRSRAFCVAKSKGRTWNRKKVAETRLLSRPPLLCHLPCWEHGFLSSNLILLSVSIWPGHTGMVSSHSSRLSV